MFLPELILMKPAIITAVLVLTSAAFAQRGVAPNGYYPSAYRGDMFTGRTIAVDPETETLSLKYEKGAKAEEFHVRLEGGCFVPSKTGEPMRAKNIPEGTVLTVLYMPKSVQEAGGKKKVYVAIGIEFVEWNGSAVALDKRQVFRCAAGKGWNDYRSFGAGPGAAVLSPNDLTVPR